MKKLLKPILAVLLIVIMAISTAGCERVSEDEAKNLVKTLVEKSYDLNDIYFGKGLNYVDSGNPNEIYMVVEVRERYITRSALIIATREVFSQSYADSLISAAFGGYNSEINQGSVQSRYLVKNDDDLIYVNKNYKTAIEEINTYKFEKIDINKISSRFIDATVYTEKGQGVEVTLIKEKSEWRLDSATY